MPATNKLGQKNPLLQRVRRHKQMALLFRSPNLSNGPAWTAEIVSPTASPAEAMHFPQTAMVETRPLSLDTTSQTAKTPPIVQRQTAEQPTPTLWQRAKTLFRKEVMPVTTTTTSSVVPQTSKPSLSVPTLQPPATSTDTYTIIQRQIDGNTSSVSHNPLAANREIEGATPTSVMVTPTAEMPATAVSQHKPTRPIYATGDTYTTIQRQPATLALQPFAARPISPSEATQLSHRSTTPDTDFPWSPLQAIYNRHHPDADQRTTAVSPTATQTTTEPPTIQRQAAPPTVPTDGSFPWGALQNIYNVHQKVALQEKEAQPADYIQRLETVSTVVEPYLPEQDVPLQDIWPVEKTATREATAVSQPTQLPVKPVQRTVADQAQDAQVRAKLDAVTPARASDSSVELVTPRRPRPTVPGKTAVTPISLKKSIQRQEKAQSAKPLTDPPNPTIETEIGPLPADLWDYLGTELPTAVPTTTDQTPHKPISLKSTTDTAVQRAIAQAEAPTALPGSNSGTDTPLPAASLVPITTETTATAVPTAPPIIQRQTEQKTTTQPNIAELGSETAVLPPSATPSKEQNITPATTNLKHQSEPISQGEAVQPQQALVASTAPDIQRAIAFAEASPAQQEEIVTHSTKAESTTTAKSSHPQTLIAQRVLETDPTADPIETVIPTSAQTERATAVTPSTPDIKAAAVPRSSQPATDQFVQREFIAASTPLSSPQPTAAIQTKPVITKLAVTPTPATRHQPGEQKKAVHPATPYLTGLANLSGHPETIQRALATAEAAPAALDPQIRQQPAITETDSLIKENSTGQEEIATNNQTPTIQREEAETAVSPNLSTSISHPTTEEQETAEPDIDELARQVYSDLKRRLTIEWERTRGRIIT